MLFTLALLNMAISAEPGKYFDKNDENEMAVKLGEPIRVLDEQETNSTEESQPIVEDSSSEFGDHTGIETDISDSTNSTGPAPTDSDQKIPLAVGLSCLGIIIIVIVVVSVVLKKKQGNAPYDPTVDLGLVENEVI